MIHIAEDFYLTGDPLNLVLTQEKINQSEGPTKGQKYYVDICYPRTLQQLLDKLVDRKVRISVSKAREIKEVDNDVQEIHKTIRWFCSKFKKEIDERLQEEKFTVKVPVYRRTNPKTEGLSGFVCEKIGERTIPASWGVKAIIEPREGDKQ
jgi:hypothetical protein